MGMYIFRDLPDSSHRYFHSITFYNWLYIRIMYAIQKIVSRFGIFCFFLNTLNGIQSLLLYGIIRTYLTILNVRQEDMCFESYGVPMDLTIFKLFFKYRPKNGRWPALRRGGWFLLGLGITGNLNKFNDLVIQEHLNRDHEISH